MRRRPAFWWPRWPRLNGVDREQAPLAGEPLQFVSAPCDEGHARADHQILDGARDEHLVRLGEGRDPGGDVHRDAGELAVDELGLACVEASSDAEAESADRLGDRRGAADPARGAVERGDEAVAGGADLLTAEALELAPHQRVVALEEIAPLAVAEPRGEGG